MRTRKRGSVRAGRRRIGAVSALFLSRQGSNKGRQGKQDKGSVSRHWLSLCLHVISFGDTDLDPRDRFLVLGRFPGFSRVPNETPACETAAHG